jgi:hypothetical protein
MLPMLLDNRLDVVYLLPGKSVTSFQPNGFEPELSLRIIALDVDVCRLVAIPSVEKEPVWAISKDGRHRVILVQFINRAIGRVDLSCQIS